MLCTWFRNRGGEKTGNYFLSCYDSEDIEAFVRKMVEKEPCQENTWVS